MWEKIYSLSSKERREKILNNLKLTDESNEILKNGYFLSDEIASKMVENQILTYQIPYSIVPNFMVDNKIYVIPMATEEPSVVAALSKASKIFLKNGGTKTNVNEKYIIGEIAYLYDEKLENFVSKNTLNIFKKANEVYPSIVKRGGGLVEINYEKKDKFLIIYLVIDTKEAMGANIVNTICEGINEYIQNNVDCLNIMSILSNYAKRSMVSASIKIKDLDLEISKKIELASELASVDKYRAATNNKGVMNAIDAILIATGNDFRAVDSAIYSYITNNSLTKWEVKNGELHGYIKLPLPVATVGGSIGVNKISKLSFELLNNPTAKELMSVIVSAGLAQNFAALLALTTTGIQKGHMKMQARIIADKLGANDNEILEILKRIPKRVDTKVIENILKEIRYEKSN